MMRGLLLTGLMCCICAARAAPGEIVFVAPTSSTMPLAQFENGKLSSGILKDLGEAIARRLQVRARFLEVPSKRVSQVLQRGEADGLCYVLPGWIEGDYHWSRPLIPNGAVVVAAPGAPVLQRLQDLADEPVGTVIGYQYGPLETLLGKRFRRDDAASMELNLNKLIAGRRRYAISEAAVVAYRLKHEPALRLRIDLTVLPFKAQCAFARGAALPFAKVNAAIDSLAEDGSVEAILNTYR